MPRTVSIAVALFGAVAASQAPEFAQQYRQRLGGAIDEVSHSVAQFDQDAAANGLDRGGAIQRLRGNTDPLAKARGDAAETSAVRLERLKGQRDAMNQSGAIGRILAIARDPDPQIARGTFEAFEPAVPTTGEGIVVAGIGFLASYGLLRLLVRPFRHFRRRPSTARRVRV